MHVSIYLVFNSALYRSQCEDQKAKLVSFLSDSYVILLLIQCHPIRDPWYGIRIQLSSQEAEKLCIIFPLRKCLLACLLTGDDIPSNQQMNAFVICCCGWSNQQTPEPVVFNGVFKSRHLDLYVIVAVARG